jgi:hypothetical protein
MGEFLVVIILNPYMVEFINIYMSHTLLTYATLITYMVAVVSTNLIGTNSSNG